MKTSSRVSCLRPLALLILVAFALDSCAIWAYPLNDSDWDMSCDRIRSQEQMDLKSRAKSARDAVDPFIATAGTGHAFPGPCRPFGLVQPSPDTGNVSWRYCSGYNHDDKVIRCFSQTHLNGTGQAGLGDIAIMPVVPNAEKRKERAELGYYSVAFDGGYWVEIAAGERIAKYRLTFPKESPASVRIDFRYGLYRDPHCAEYLNMTSCVEQVGKCGFRGENFSRVFAPRQIGFYLQFDRDFLSYTNGVCTFAEGEKIGLTIALAAGSGHDAEENFNREKDNSFDSLVFDTQCAWGELFSFANERLFDRRRSLHDDDSKVFYACLYHLFIQPNALSDRRYSTFSLWDTYRTAHPLYEALVPERVPDFVNSLLDHYQRYGYLPRWELWGRETNCMVGDSAVIVIANAYRRHYSSVDWKMAFKAVDETLTTNRRTGNPGYYPPREERDIYEKYGYYPFDLVTRESVSRTLEACYADFKAAEFARALGKNDRADYFERRSWNFTNLWDQATLCFRPKDSTGAWLAPFESARQSVHYTEGSPLQYAWFVPHRVDWLIAAMGGRKAFCARLDDFFAGRLAPDEARGYSCDVTGLIGDYSHGNEPCHFVPYLYAAAGQPEKTAALLRRICSEFYRPTPDGWCGNDDCGQMSAWYIDACRRLESGDFKIER